MSVQNFKIKHGLNLGDHELIDPLGNINLPAGAAIQVDGAPLDALPDQTGQTGKFLSTNGSIASWDAITQYTPPTNQGAANFLAGDGAYKPVTMPTLVSELVNDAGYQTSSQVATAVANLVDAAPNTLDTLNELAAALGDNPNFATTVSNQIGAKQDALVSGTNIKTVNGNSLLGSGNIAIATYTDTDVLNYLTAHQYATFDNVNQGLASRAELSGATFTGAVSAPSFSGDGHNLTNLDWTQIGNTPSSISTRNAYTASAGDTVFAATYTLGSVEVYLNGMHLMKDVDYTASNGTSITLTDPAATGDEIEIIGFSTFNLVNVYNKTETDTLITTVNNNLALKANQSTTYTKTEVDTSLATKANQITTYTKTEVDTSLATKANQITTYTKTEVDTSLALKANLTDLTPTNVSDKHNTSTGYFSLPKGTTAQRPASADAGDTRFNTELGYAEYFTGSVWNQFQPAPYTINYVVVGGGGSGGGGQYGLGGAGGGGAGGYLAGTSLVASTTSMNVIIGAGGAAIAQNSLSYGNDGSSSQLGTLATALGGGGGGYGSSGAGGRSGGSGGGGGYNGYNTSSNGGSGTVGQGNNGGGVWGGSASGGGGGGATAAGASNTGSGGGSGGVGGAGATWLDGNTYARGGYGGSNGMPTSEAANSGNGGNAVYNGSASQGAGGSGVVIIRYSGTPRGTGGTITQVGGYTYHTFTSSGTFIA